MGEKITQEWFQIWYRFDRIHFCFHFHIHIVAFIWHPHLPSVKWHVFWPALAWLSLNFHDNVIKLLTHLAQSTWHWLPCIGLLDIGPLRQCLASTCVGILLIWLWPLAFCSDFISIDALAWPLCLASTFDALTWRSWLGWSRLNCYFQCYSKVSLCPDSWTCDHKAVSTGQWPLHSRYLDLNFSLDYLTDLIISSRH